MRIDAYGKLIPDVRNGEIVVWTGVRDGMNCALLEIGVNYRVIEHFNQVPGWCSLYGFEGKGFRRDMFKRVSVCRFEDVS